MPAETAPNFDQVLEIEARQEAVLEQLDELEKQILAVLKEFGGQGVQVKTSPSGAPRLGIVREDKAA
jgi:uncharacterized membrane protein